MNEHDHIEMLWALRKIKTYILNIKWMLDKISKLCSIGKTRLTFAEETLTEQVFDLIDKKHGEQSTQAWSLPQFK